MSDKSKSQKWDMWAGETKLGTVEQITIDGKPVQIKEGPLNDLRPKEVLISFRSRKNLRELRKLKVGI